MSVLKDFETQLMWFRFVLEHRTSDNSRFHFQGGTSGANTGLTELKSFEIGPQFMGSIVDVT